VSRDVLATIEESRLMQALTRAFLAIHRIAETSIVVRRLDQVRRWWNRLAARERRRAAGIMLLTAGSVHMLLSLPRPTPGALWMVVPVWAMFIGALLILMSVAAQGERTSSSNLRP
jgi:hypothetical protein